jgi:hypothetical protein
MKRDKAVYIRRRVVVVVVVAALIGGGAWAAIRDDPSSTTAEPGDDESPDPGSDRFVPKKAYLKDACELPPEWVRYIWRGWDPSPARSHDLVLVPPSNSYLGAPTSTPHSGPYDYLQEVPFIWYGPGFIRSEGRVDLGREVTSADIAPTQAQLMRFDGWPSERPGRPLTEILEDTDDTPKLLVTISVDGLGWNVLDRWPDSWPYLKQLMESDGTNIDGAVVGSSPSITPAVHTNMSTGAFPRDHGVTAIAVRRRNGDIVGGFALSADSQGEPSEADPTINLRMETIADLWDREHDNEARVGMVAGGNYVTGFVGNGAALEGADKDIAAFHGKSEDGEHIWATNPEFYSVPGYVNTEVDGPEGDVEAVDASDGEVDGKWRGHNINLDGSPALTPWQVRGAIELIDREGFGDDDIADLFYLHLKAPDAAGHLYNMIAEEQAEVIESVDRGIEELIGFLDNEMPGEYVLVLTADHGQTPNDTDAWPIKRDEIYKDVGERFGGVIERTSSTTFFMDKAEMTERGITVEKVASFMSRYRIGDNIPPGEEVEGAEDRLEERLFEAVFPGKALSKVVSCTGALEG